MRGHNTAVTDSAPFTSPLAQQLSEEVTERLVRYARVDTQSSREGTGTPSTECQWDLARLLEGELTELGLEDVELDEHGYVFATLPATVEGTPTIGLLAHIDVSPDAPAEGVEPIVHRGYDGGVIELPKGGTKLDPATVPGLAEAEGQDLVTSSGDTLLGADDKAGMAEVMTAVAHLAANPDLPRPAIRVGFTPDEEIGKGPILFDVERFGARCAYTLDGSDLGELQAESFTGSEVVVRIKGVDVHPGSAKDILINATRLAGEVLAALPADLTPERTEGRQGFLHPVEIAGDAVEATRQLHRARLRGGRQAAAHRPAARDRRAGRGRAPAGHGGGHRRAPVPEHARPPGAVPRGGQPTPRRRSGARAWSRSRRRSAAAPTARS